MQISGSTLKWMIDFHSTTLPQQADNHNKDESLFDKVPAIYIKSGIPIEVFI